MKKLNEANVLFCSHFPQCILNSSGFCGLSICIYCIYSCDCGCVLLSLFTAPAELTLYIIYCVAAASPLQLLTKRFPHKTHTSQIHRRSICISISISISNFICICIRIYSCCAAAVAQSSNPLKTHIICRYRQRRSQRQQVAQVASASTVISVTPVSLDSKLS